MKLKEIKHNHTLTDILKVFIFALIMLAPIGMIGTKCLYVICNKNAYQSYSDENYVVEQKVNTQDFTSLVNNTNAYLNLVASNDYDSLTQSSYQVQFKNLTINNTSYNEGILTLGANIGYRDGYYLSIYDNDFHYIQRYAINDYVGTYQFFYVSSSSSNAFYYPNAMYDNSITYLVLTSTTNKLDNVFEYSVSQLEQSPLFNWTQNTAIYSGVATMNSQLGINSQAINILLVYWFLMIVIYIIIDIILKVYTVLTHMLTRKV